MTSVTYATREALWAHEEESQPLEETRDAFTLPIGVVVHVIVYSFCYRLRNAYDTQSSMSNTTLKLDENVALDYN